MEEIIILDTNIIFSALYSTSTTIRDILLDKKNTFYAPNFIIAEIFKHKERLVKITKLTDEEFVYYFNGIIENIRFIPLDFISSTNRIRAFELCVDIDEKDTPFIALSLELNAPLWTRDIKLKNGLVKKGFTHFKSIDS